MWILAVSAFLIAGTVFIFSMIDYFSTQRATKQLQDIEPSETVVPRPEREQRPKLSVQPRTEFIPFDAGIRSSIRKHLETLRTPLDVDGLLTLKNSLKTIAQELGGTPLARMFDGLAEMLEFATADSFANLALNKTLQVIPYLNGHLNDRVKDVRNSLRPQGRERFVVALEELDEAISRLEELERNWSGLRESACLGIGPPPTGEFIELKHTIDNVLVHPMETRQLNWNPQTVIQNPSILLQLATWFETLVQHAGWNFDYICSMSAAGLPLAVMLSAQLKKSLLQVDNATYSFMPGGPRPGGNVVVVDTTLQSGKHILAVREKVERVYNANFEGAIVWVDNDLSPRLKERPEQFTHLMEQGRIIYLYKMSDLYTLWENRREAALAGGGSF